MAIAADGRFFVCTTTGGVSVVSPDGPHLDDILIGNNATNCVFDGPTLYVTATQVDDCEALMRTGSFWRIETGATGPLPSIPGML